MLLAQAHLPFLRMDIDIHRRPGQGQMQDKQRIAVGRQHGTVSLADSVRDKRTDHCALIDKQMLASAVVACVCGQSNEAFNGKSIF